MRQFLKVMKALSDPNRVKIIKMLQRKKMCVCELQTALGVAQPTVSKHLRILEDAGLVTFEKDGLWVNYKLSKDNNPYSKTMLRHLKNWLEDEPEIVELIKKLPYINREDICAKRPLEKDEPISRYSLRYRRKNQ